MSYPWRVCHTTVVVDKILKFKGLVKNTVHISINVFYKDILLIQHYHKYLSLYVHEIAKHNLHISLTHFAPAKTIL